MLKQVKAFTMAFRDSFRQSRRNAARAMMRRGFAKQDSAFAILDAIEHLDYLPMPKWWKEIFEEEGRHRINELFNFNIDIPVLRTFK